MTDPRPTPPERCETCGEVHAPGDWRNRPTPLERAPECLDEHEIAEVYANPWIVHAYAADQIANTLANLAAALEATAAERDRLKAALKRRIRMVHETRAELDRAHATLREIADDPYPGRGAHHVRLARERLENP
jgi:hypothetical protein